MLASERWWTVWEIELRQLCADGANTEYPAESSKIFLCQRSRFEESTVVLRIGRRYWQNSPLISGTRDLGLSAVVYTHAQSKAGATADLHVWEGTPHCSFVNPVVNPNVKVGNRGGLDVIVKFFYSNLGR